MSDSVNITEQIDSDHWVQVLPFYIVCQESASMGADGIALVNECIKELFRAINSDPVVDAKARVSIVAFNDSAEVILPLTQLSSVATVPGCTASCGTSYAAAFTLLRRQIESDVASLRATNRVLRPWVFFICDGEPNPGDKWGKAHAALVDPSFHLRPNIVTLGLGAVCDATLWALASQMPATAEVLEGAVRRLAFRWADEIPQPGARLVVDVFLYLEEFLRRAYPVPFPGISGLIEVSGPSDERPSR